MAKKQRNPPKKAAKATSSSTSATNANYKTRNYSLICYAESLPVEKALDILKPKKYYWAKHDKDKKDDESGELKKEHFHLLVSFENPRGVEAVRKYLESKAGFYVQAEPVSSMHSMIRYLVHRDNPEKVQYDTSIIVSNCYPDVNAAICGDPADKVVTGYQLFLRGATFFELAQYLGRDWIINHGRILEGYVQMAYSDPDAKANRVFKEGSLNWVLTTNRHEVVRPCDPAETDEAIEAFQANDDGEIIWGINEQTYV